LYSYDCQCGESFDKIMPIEFRHEAHCPECGRLAIKRFSIFNFTFGWRLTDNSFDPVTKARYQGGKDKIERAI